MRYERKPGESCANFDDRCAKASSSDEIVLDAAMFDEANRCPHLTEGRQCLDMVGHRGEHEPSRFTLLRRG